MSDNYLMNCKQLGGAPLRQNAYKRVSYKQSYGCKSKSRVIGSYEFRDQNFSIQQPNSLEHDLKPMDNMIKNNYQIEKINIQAEVIEEEKREMA